MKCHEMQSASAEILRGPTTLGRISAALSVFNTRIASHKHHFSLKPTEFSVMKTVTFQVLVLYLFSLKIASILN